MNVVNTNSILKNTQKTTKCKICRTCLQFFPDGDALWSHKCSSTLCASVNVLCASQLLPLTPWNIWKWLNDNLLGQIFFLQFIGVFLIYKMFRPDFFAYYLHVYLAGRRSSASEEHEKNECGLFLFIARSHNYAGSFARLKNLALLQVERVR